jgi:hypothetical protein
MQESQNVLNENLQESQNVAVREMAARRECPKMKKKSMKWTIFASFQTNVAYLGLNYSVVCDFFTYFASWNHLCQTIHVKP